MLEVDLKEEEKRMETKERVTKVGRGAWDMTVYPSIFASERLSRSEMTCSEKTDTFLDTHISLPEWRKSIYGGVGSPL